MRSPLDEGESWELRGLRFEGTLELTLIELGPEAAPAAPGLPIPEKAPNPKTRLSDVVSELLRSARRIVPVPNGRVITIGFERVLAHLVTDKACVADDKTEVVESPGRLRAMSRSRFLELFNASGLGPVVAGGPYLHYRVPTEGQIIDVISTQPPRVTVRRGGVTLLSVVPLP